MCFDFLGKLGSLFWFLLELSHEPLWVCQVLGSSGSAGQLRWLDLPVSPCGLSSQVFSLNSGLRTAFQEEEGKVARFLEAWTLKLAHVVFITFYWPYLVPRSIQGKRNRFHVSMEKSYKELEATPAWHLHLLNMQKQGPRRNWKVERERKRG